MSLRIVSVCIAILVGAGPAFAAEPPSGESQFATAADCIACHTRLAEPTGEDVSIGFDWRATMMANSARDPYWQAAVRREVTDHPIARAAIEDKCSTCHMPMMRSDAAAQGGQGEVFASLATSAPRHALAMDGVSCTVCHQMSAEGFGEHASFDGGFKIDRTAGSERVIFGPHEIDPGRQSVMRSAANYTPRSATHLQQSELCATCHTLFTTALDDAGQPIATLPEQVPYQEWLHSEYRTTRSCQNCHMPEVVAETAISSVLGQPRPRLSQHTFRGGNAHMLTILNKYRDELGVTALPQELDAAVSETRRYLATEAAALGLEAVTRSRGALSFDVRVASSTGHKLPTAYPARRAWLHVVVVDAAGAVIFESGALRPSGAIAGNANDDDGTAFEPHYDEVTAADQVQIYEAIMVDRSDAVTTGLLRGVRYVKDNRLLPRGFDKATAASDVAVHGAAADDGNFSAGGDRVRYRVPVGGQGALRVSVELLYQSIGYRWAENLRAYDSEESRRFNRYYSETAAASSSRLAATEVAVPAL